MIFLPSIEKSRKQLVAPRALHEHIKNRLIGNEKRKPGEEGLENAWRVSKYRGLAN